MSSEQLATLVKHLDVKRESRSTVISAVETILGIDVITIEPT